MNIYTDKFTNIFVILGELLALLVLFFLVMHLLRVNAKRLGKTTHFSSYYEYFEQAQNLVKWVFFVLFAMCGIALAAWDITLMVQNQNVWEYTLHLVTAILPLSFWIDLGLNLLRIIGIILATYLALRLLDWAMAYFLDEAKQAELLRIETAPIEVLFARIRHIIRNAIYLFALVLAMRMLPLPFVIGETTSILLTVYLVLVVGRLLVRFVPDILDTLDAFSKKYIRVINLDDFYAQAHTLIPLLRRSLEYMIYVQAATWVLKDIPWIGNWFPTYRDISVGDILLRVIGIFFLSRVLVEIFNWLIDKFMLGNDELSEGQQQQRLTFAPLIRSMARYATYFGAGLFLLRVFSVNVTPIVTAIGGVGLIVGLAAQPVLNDLVSGMFILFENLYMVGDQIEVSGARGVVEAIEVRTTHIRGEDGRIYMLRNGQIGQVINYSRNYSYAVVSLTVDNEVDLDGVYETVHIIGKQLAATNKTVLSPTEIEGIQEVGPDGVQLRIVTKTKPGHGEKVARDLRARIKKSFAGETQVLPTVTKVMVK